MTSYTLRKAAADRVRTDLVVIAVTTGRGGALSVAEGGEAVAAAYGRGFAPLLASLGFGGGAGETVRVPSADDVNAAQVLVVGLGPGDLVTDEGLRRASGTAARATGNVASVALALPTAQPSGIRAVVEGFASGLYRYHGQKTSKAPGGVAEVVVLSDAARRSDAQAALRAAVTLDRFAATARDWVNTPPNLLVPTAFADRVASLTEGTGVEFELLTAARLNKLGCGGILGVGNGSENPPCLVKLTWTPEEPRGSVALVGKGITFDSGGLTIKPGSSMSAMKSDMAGAAAVVAAIHTIAALEIPVAVTAYVPMAENMVSGSSVRPGDVLTMLSGKTVEVTNTDAEGRLILADALTMAARAEPDVIYEISTLTGPCVVALGDRIAGLFGDDETVAEVERVAAATGELFWHLPIPAEQRTSVRTESKVADLLQHNWVRWGSALYAAAFLEQFVEDVPWAHFDIAGPGFNTGGPWGHVPSGGTGFGISTLVELVAQRG